MADHEMYATSDLVEPLADRVIILSREQMFRLVTQSPQRLSMETLAALCDIFSVAPNDLIEIDVVNASVPKPALAARKTKPSARSVAIRRPRSSS